MPQRRPGPLVRKCTALQRENPSLRLRPDRRLASRNPAKTATAPTLVSFSSSAYRPCKPAPILLVDCPPRFEAGLSDAIGAAPTLSHRRCFAARLLLLGHRTRIQLPGVARWTDRVPSFRQLYRDRD